MKKIVCLGDSITWGYPKGHSWVHLLATRLPAEFVNSGVSGDTLADMENRIQEDVLDHRPDFCILLGGTNDVFLGVPAAESRHHLISMQTSLNAAGITILAGLPVPALMAREEMLLSQLRDFIRGQFSIVIEFQKSFYNHHGKIRSAHLPDAVHPSDAAHVLMADEAERVVAPLL